MLLWAGASAASGTAHASTISESALVGDDSTTLPCSPAASSTAITSATSSPVVVGQPVTVYVQTTGVQCPGADETTPTGTVTVSDGTVTCAAALSGSGGVATGSCAIIEGRVGTFSLTATYGGDSTFAPSSSQSTSITVNQASTSTLLTLSPNGPYAGGERITANIEVDAQYTGAGEPAPTGTATVSEVEGIVTWTCTATLTGSQGVATGSCAIPQYSIGTFSLVAQYGDSSFETSSSAPTSVTVSPATTSTTLTVSATSVSYGDEQVARFHVTVSPQYPGTTPDGTVTIRESTTTLCTIQLRSARGSCRLAATTLPRGNYHLAATYNGNPNFDPSKSAKQSLTVTS